MYKERGGEAGGNLREGRSSEEKVGEGGLLETFVDKFCNN